MSEGGSSRQAMVENMLASVGGKLEAFYFSFGNDDAVIIFDMPDNVSAAAIGMTVAAAGAVTGRLTVLLTPGEIDQAAKKSPAYRPPGG